MTPFAKKLERTWEGNVAGLLRRVCRLQNYHTAEKSMLGVPDRYIAGGNWMEMKVIEYAESVNALRFFRPAQKNFLRRMHEAGDHCWAAVLFVRKYDGTCNIAIMPWPQFAAPERWTEEMILALPHYRDLERVLRARFGKDKGERYSVYCY